MEVSEAVACGLRVGIKTSQKIWGLKHLCGKNYWTHRDMVAFLPLWCWRYVGVLNWFLRLPSGPDRASENPAGSQSQCCGQSKHQSNTFQSSNSQSKQPIWHVLDGPRIWFFWTNTQQSMSTIWLFCGCRNGLGRLEGKVELKLKVKISVLSSSWSFKVRHTVQTNMQLCP